MLRFVLLRHECPPDFEKPSHWDFMLEWEGVLRTWDLRDLPTPWAAVIGEPDGSDTVAAYPLADHRLAYLEYEGPISGGRGSVQRCDGGTYEVLSEEGQKLTVLLEGALLKGTICLAKESQTCLQSTA